MPDEPISPAIRRRRCGSLPQRRRVLPLLLLLALASPPALSHGHPAVVDPDRPDAWKYRLCAEMTTVAIQALHGRERGRAKPVYADDGGPGPAIANAIVDKVYAEPSITSPKRAEAFARSYCNERLQER